MAKPNQHQPLLDLWKELEVYQTQRADCCPEPDCPGLCCNFEIAAMMPMVSWLEWQVIKGFLSEQNWELPELKGFECPFLQNKRCMVYVVRPTGCRVYFCHMIQEADYQEYLPWIEKAKQLDPEFRKGTRPILDWFYQELFDY